MKRPRKQARISNCIRFVILLLALSFVFSATQIFAQVTIRPEVVAKHSMVASAHPLASNAGLAILKAGGNAVDAAVAAAFALCVVEPNATGLGGGGVAVIYMAGSGKTTAIDYLSMAPLADLSSARFPANGHKAVAVPGVVAGLSAALEKYGTMSLAEVLVPAIMYARDGFIVSNTLAQTITDAFDPISKNDALLAILAPNGLPLTTGNRMKNLDLARSLEKLADRGSDVFYKGELANAIVADMTKSGGYITKADLAAYKAIEREPLRGTYRGYEIVSATPPISGLSVIEILNILENFDLASNPPLSTLNIHIIAEAMKHGFADNSAFVGDPAFFKVPVTGLIDKGYAKARAAEINLNAISKEWKVGSLSTEQSSMTHISVVDSKGNMVALTQTISSLWGAKVCVPGTGIILNNEMRNWSAEGPNAYAPGKRMRTTTAPTIIVKDGKTFASIGTPGAARSISTVALLLVELIDYKMGVQAAIEAPRFYARDSEKALSLEARVPVATQTALKAMGYSLTGYSDFDPFFGGAQAIIVDRATGELRGGVDPRRDGAVFGY